MRSPQSGDEMEFEVAFVGSQSNHTLILLKGFGGGFLGAQGPIRQSYPFES